MIIEIYGGILNLVSGRQFNPRHAGVFPALLVASIGLVFAVLLFGPNLAHAMDSGQPKPCQVDEEEGQFCIEDFPDEPWDEPDDEPTGGGGAPTSGGTTSGGNGGTSSGGTTGSLPGLPDGQTNCHPTADDVDGDCVFDPVDLEITAPDTEDNGTPPDPEDDGSTPPPPGAGNPLEIPDDVFSADAQDVKQMRERRRAYLLQVCHEEKRTDAECDRLAIKEEDKAWLDKVFYVKYCLARKHLAGEPESRADCEYLYDWYREQRKNSNKCPMNGYDSDWDCWIKEFDRPPSDKPQPPGKPKPHL